jgi:UDP-glucuronate 4-epimerase
MTILVTGVAGFIGFHVAKALRARGEAVLGIDNVNDYYDVRLKQARLAQFEGDTGFSFHQVNIADRQAMNDLLTSRTDITGVVHLAAQAGVRYSLINPFAYIESNVTGQVVLLELARHWPQLKHFVYASSSSVYGANTKIPFSIDDPVDHPVSLYAATKRTDELFGHTYAHLYKLPLTGLRFFTVYGPWGRPDMAPFIFTKAIIEGQPIQLFNQGQMKRDFTYVDDIVSGVLAALDHPPQGEGVPHRIYNLGNNQVEELGRFVAVLEEAIGKKAIINYAPMQNGDVVITSADIGASQRDLSYQPTTLITEGLPRFVEWYRSFYN